jgi:hypothetical protein
LIDTFIWVFFPALCHRHIHDNSYKRTSIPKEQYTLWYDKVLLPAVVAAVQDPSILQYIPRHALDRRVFPLSALQVQMRVWMCLVKAQGATHSHTHFNTDTLGRYGRKFSRE